jgi:hypothetical protein
MKKVLLLTSFLITCGNGQAIKDVTEMEHITETPVRKQQIPHPIIVTPQPINKLIDALIYVESRGEDSAIGDTHLKEPSIGVLQIRPVMVREVNRILKLKRTGYKFKRKDRFSREKSIEMFMIWYEFHHKDSDYEKISRSWNGGPKGHRNNRTLPYWEKVQQELNK